MALTAEQRQARARYLGSSEAAAVANRNPDGWEQSYDVWARKTGRVPVRDDDGDVATRLGTYLEPGILAWTEDYLGKHVAPAVFFEHPNQVMCANLDGLVVDGELAIVEVKTSGLLARPGFWTEWGAEGTDEVPTHVLLQVHHQFAVCDGVQRLDVAEGVLPSVAPVARAYVPVLLAGRGFVMYVIERSQALVENLQELEERFWRDHVLADVPPPDAIPQMDTLRLLKREPGKIVPVDPFKVVYWLEAKAKANEFGKLEELARRQVIAALEDADAGDCGAEVGQVTYLEGKRAGYTVEATTFRTLRHKAPGKKGGKRT